MSSAYRPLRVFAVILVPKGGTGCGTLSNRNGTAHAFFDHYLVEGQAVLGHLERDITERGAIGWRLVVAGFAPDKAVGASSIQPLIRLGLLDADPADPNRLNGQRTRPFDLGTIPRRRRQVSPDDLASF
jgi:hypothetical protein